MLTRSLLAPLAVCLLMLGGCASFGPHGWEAAGSAPYSVPSQGYVVTLPQGWIEESNNGYSAMILSRHGLDLESIHITRGDNDKAFPSLKKSASPDEAPGDLADDLIAEIKSESGDVGFQIVKNEPAMVGGKSAIHLLIEYRTPDGVRYRQDEYAICTADGFYQLRYQAPVLHYYDSSQPVFAAMLQSFQFIPMKGH